VSGVWGLKSLLEVVAAAVTLLQPDWFEAAEVGFEILSSSNRMMKLASLLT
jgi:hypothetical protein